MSLGCLNRVGGPSLSSMWRNVLRSAILQGRRRWRRSSWRVGSKLTMKLRGNRSSPSISIVREAGSTKILANGVAVYPDVATPARNMLENFADLSIDPRHLARPRVEC